MDRMRERDSETERQVKTVRHGTERQKCRDRTKRQKYKKSRET